MHRKPAGRFSTLEISEAAQQPDAADGAGLRHKLFRQGWQNGRNAPPLIWGVKRWRPTDLVRTAGGFLLRARTVGISVAAVGGTLGLALMAARGSDEVGLDDRRRDDMVMSVLEAHVAPENWAALRQAYETRASILPPQIVESFLAQSATDPTVWRILTVWHSREGLEQVRRSGETPTGVLIFRDAGVEPSLTLFTVWANPHAPSVPTR